MGPSRSWRTRAAVAPASPTKIVWPLEGGGWMELSKGAAGTNGTLPGSVQRLDQGARLSAFSLLLSAFSQNGAGTENTR